MSPLGNGAGRLVALGADPVWSAWSAWSAAAGVSFRVGDLASLTEDGTVVLVSPWDAPAPQAVGEAVRRLPPTARLDVWLVCTEPSAEALAEVMAAGGRGSLPRVPDAEAVGRALALAAWWPDPWPPANWAESGAPPAAEREPTRPWAFGLRRGPAVRPMEALRRAGRALRCRGGLWRANAAAMLRSAGGRPRSRVPAAAAGPRVPTVRPAVRTSPPRGRSPGPPAASRAHPTEPGLGGHARRDPEPWWAWPAAGAGELAVLGAWPLDAEAPLRALHLWRAWRGRPDEAATCLGTVPAPVLGAVHPAVPQAAAARAVAVVARHEWEHLHNARGLVQALRVAGAADIRVWLLGEGLAPVAVRQLALALGVPCAAVPDPLEEPVAVRHRGEL